MPNIYQWIVFVGTVIVLVLEITNFKFIGGGGKWDPPSSYLIEPLLLVALTVGVGVFLYRVAGKARGRKKQES